jgi:hypothetical protein
MISLEWSARVLAWSAQAPRLGIFLTPVLAQAVVVIALEACAQSFAADVDTTRKLNLGDLPAYRKALDGQPTANDGQAGDPPAQVGFRELWDHCDTYLGRRVAVTGRVERIFRQAAVGSFPALAEVWITSQAGDPFCVVFAQPQRMLDAGRSVRFTGTFLKMVSYTASDGTRLAPLIVGPQPPLYESNPSDKLSGLSRRENFTEAFPSAAGRNSKSSGGREYGLGENWLLALALAFVATGIITWQHIRTPKRRHRWVRQRQEPATQNDPPLEFLN